MARHLPGSLSLIISLTSEKCKDLVLSAWIAV
jgi:hypothetical protein